MLPPSVAALGACTAPGILALIDAAFERPGGPAQRLLEAEVCPTCPIWRECLADAVQNGEHGPWGGTNARTRRRYVPTTPNRNMRDVIHPGHGRQATTQLTNRARMNQIADQLSELGVTGQEVKRWAVEQGHIPEGTTRGRVGFALIGKYATAHGMTVTAPLVIHRHNRRHHA